jgi:GH25 family lysozyme M1 (1,4-beta-N-acetylmuramidase)
LRDVERSVTVERMAPPALLHLARISACGGVVVLAGCSATVPGEPVGTWQQADTCATGTTLEGVDVSVYDGTVSWTQVKASGRAFGIAKATEGSTLQDGEFATNWPAMKSAGIVRSAYHFFHCDTAPTTQATFFLGVMGALEPGDLPPSLDFEDTTTCTASTGIAMAIEWLDAVASATGTLPILYTSVNVLSNFQNTQTLAGHAQLWVASRGVTCPDLPAPFTAWSFWQYSLTGTAPGLPNSNGMADLDQFNGDMSALLGLTVGGSPPDASSGDSGPPACTASGVAGTCIDTSVCAAMPGYVSTPGLCPGPASEQCCTRTGDASLGDAGDAGTSPRGDGGGAGDAGEADGDASPADHAPNPSSASCGCSAALGGATTWTSILPAVVFLAGGVASLRRRGRQSRRAGKGWTLRPLVAMWEPGRPPGTGTDSDGPFQAVS